LKFSHYFGVPLKEISPALARLAATPGLTLGGEKMEVGDPDDPALAGLMRILQGGHTPVVGEAHMGANGFYEEHHASTSEDGFLDYPCPRDGYAWRGVGDSMRPRIKPGQFVVVAPHAPIEAGDEVAVHLKDGRKMIKVLGPRRRGLVELHSINERAEEPIITVQEHEIEHMHAVENIVNPGKYHPE
jgi:phage repressor protein C with HTH and peptisase S24 domain